MFDFKAPQDDILFSLVHVADAARIASWDSDMATDIIGHFSNLAEGVIAPLNASEHAQGARLEQGRVRMPDGFKNAYQQLADDGWQGLTAPESLAAWASRLRLQQGCLKFSLAPTMPCRWSVILSPGLSRHCAGLAPHPSSRTGFHVLPAAKHYPQCA